MIQWSQTPPLVASGSSITSAKLFAPRGTLRISISGFMLSPSQVYFGGIVSPSLNAPLFIIIFSSISIILSQKNCPNEKPTISGRFLKEYPSQLLCFTLFLHKRNKHAPPWSANFDNLSVFSINRRFNFYRRIKYSQYLPVFFNACFINRP